MLSDDQGPWAVHLHGRQDAYTLNLDRLAREGAVFTNAFTPTPVCSPARASILTGRYGSEFGIYDWLKPKVDAVIGLPREAVTWPSLLHASGYTTGLAGKWHLGEAAQFHPQQLGYDWFSGFLGGGITPTNPTLERNGANAARQGFIVDLVTDDAMEFIAQNRERPFAVSVHFREPHAPYLPVPQAVWAKFDQLDPVVPNPDLSGLNVPEVKKRTREYLASVAALDHNVGRILQQLDELGLSSRTIVIFTSDHGYNIGHHGIAYKGNGQWLLHKKFLPVGTLNVPAVQRPNMFDTTVKVPLYVRWPGVVTAGRVVQETVSHLDWLPTFVAVTGGRVPAHFRVQGRDLTPVLRGTPSSWENDFYSEYTMRHDAVADLRMYRTVEWKIIRDLANPERDELYDLRRDPDESKNLIASDDPRVRAARTELDAKLQARIRNVPRASFPGARVGAMRVSAEEEEAAASSDR